MLLLFSADFFSKLTFSKNSFSNTVGVSDSWIQLKTNSIIIIIIVFKGYQKKIKVTASREKVKCPYTKVQDNTFLLKELYSYKPCQEC